MSDTPTKPIVVRRKRRGKFSPSSPTEREQARAAVKQKHVDTLNRNRQVTVHLVSSHSINGIMYGPGSVTVPSHVAKSLLDNDQHAIAEEVAFRGTKAAIVKPVINKDGRIGFIGKVVPTETFDTDLNSAEPAIEQKG